MNGEAGYIAVEGPIGVGKTSLARRLATSLGAETVLEQAEKNLFLPRFYAQPREVALPTQLTFLFQRARQLGALVQNDLFRPARIADFILEKDWLFAGVTLEEDELALYHEVYQRVAPKAPRPDLVIYLQASAGVLLQRIGIRRREFERGIRGEYLEQVVDAYTQFFHHYTASRVLIVNAETVDLVNGDTDYQRLLAEIGNQRGRRSYFNPEVD